MNIGIISVGMGNVASVKNMLMQIDLQPELLIKPPLESMFFDWIILPGVGSYNNGIEKLKESGWFAWLKKNQRKKEGKSSLMGICLGMQLLCDGSEEGDLGGLGFIPGYFKKFKYETDISTLKIPHMCWNDVLFNENKIEWAKKINQRDPRFYFVHSYHYTHDTDEYIIGTTNYGYNFASAIKMNNVLGFQFHPEKSHKYGKMLLAEIFECQN